MNETEKAVFEYMKSQNRPYSAIDIFSNLHKKYGKTAIVKALETLSLKNKLMEKNYGKSKIYVVHQSQFPDVSDVELRAIDEKTSKLDKDFKEAQTKLSSSSIELKSLSSSLTTEEALKTLKSLNSEVEELEKNVNKLKNNCTTIIDATEKNKLTEKRKYVVSQWRKRKRMTVDLMNAVLEGYPKSKKQFLEEVGLETDEDFKVTIPKV